MRYKITESQLKKINEYFDSEKVICDKCGWSWSLSDGGDDLFICHKCGKNNEE